MKIISFGRIFIVLMFCTAFSAVSVNGQDEVAYQYAFLGVTSDGQRALYGINESLDADAVQNITMTRPIPDNWREPSAGFSSPNGEWIALFSRDMNEPSQSAFYWHTRLLNVSTGEIVDIDHPMITVGNGNLGLPISETVAWSPNSEYLALNLQNGLNTDIYIYSLTDRVLNNLTSDESTQYRIAWSPSSNQLATVMTDCPNTSFPYCMSWLSVFDVPQLREVSQIMLDVEQTQWAEAAGAACEITWSPDGQWIAFQSVCSRTDGTQEVYLWNLLDGDVAQITDFTALPPETLIYRAADYEMLWLNPDQLLIGLYYTKTSQWIDGVAEFMEVAQTVRFDRSTNNFTPLLNQKVEAWAYNPIANVVAARFDSEPEADDDRQSPIGRMDMLGENLLLEGGIVERSVIIEELPLGCILDWSPDGRYLAYRRTQSDRCTSLTNTIGFRDQSGETLGEISATDLEVEYLIPIGWIIY